MKHTLSHFYLLLFIHARRVLPRWFRHGLMRLARTATPGLESRLTDHSHAASALRAEQGFRGIGIAFTRNLREFSSLVGWLLRDPDKPAVARAVIPTSLKFAATFLQASAFGIVAGYFSLAGNDWKFEWRDYVFDWPPTLGHVLTLVALVFSVYALSAIFNFIAGNMMLRIGLEYQTILSKRLLSFYRTVTQSPSADSYLSSDNVHMIINSECRYLGRALLMLYNIIHQTIIAVIGFAALAVLDIVLAGICVAFIFVALMLQVVVMGKTLVDTREMMIASGPNATKIRDAISAVSLNPNFADVTVSELDQRMSDPDILRYDTAYYDRLRIGLLSNLAPQLTFAVFFAGLFGYALYAMNVSAVTTTTAIQYVFSLRFFFGGLVGILGGFVSIVSFKPFFDNYLSVMEGYGRLPEKGTESVTPNAGNAIAGWTPGTLISIVANGLDMAWLDIVLALKTLGVREIETPLQQRLSIVHTFLPYAGSDGYRAFGLPAPEALEAFAKAVPTHRSALEGLKTKLDAMAASHEGSAAIWEELSREAFILGMLAAAYAHPQREFLVLSEAALRGVSERDRAAVLAPFSDKRIAVTHNSLPTIVLKPEAAFYVLIDHSGVIAQVAAEDILNLPQAVVATFNATQIGAGKIIQLMDDLG